MTGRPPPGKIRTVPGATRTRDELVDRTFFGLGTLAAVWLAWALLAVSIHSWWGIGLVVVFWLVLAYVALPRLNRILASVYVPDYFIGRTRTSDGLLGDPLNLALLGSAEQLATALHRAGWTRSDPVDLRSSLRIIRATLERRSYDSAPVSPLLLFGRNQDASYQQQVDGNPAQRHHVRLWRTPDGWLLPGGHRVDWLAGATYDRRVGLSLFTLQVTHKIDADIDVERDHVVGTLTAAEPAATVDPLADFTTGYHARNGGGDLVHTDGTLPVVDLSAVVPDAAAPPLVSPAVAARRPWTVLLPAIVTLVAGVGGALAVRSELHASDTTAGDVATLAGIVVALLAAGLAVLVLRGSVLARRALLVVSAMEVAVRISAYAAASSDHARLVAVAHSATAVLTLVALSSPSARVWSTRADPTTT